MQLQSVSNLLLILMRKLFPQLIWLAADGFSQYVIFWRYFQSKKKQRFMILTCNHIIKIFILINFVIYDSYNRINLQRNASGFSMLFITSWNEYHLLVVTSFQAWYLKSVNHFYFFYRENNRQIDLNRSFPDYFQKNRTSPIQPETEAMMNWLSKTQFILSASLHSGALVANYPFENLPDSSK